jgi:hypothetical protein
MILSIVFRQIFRDFFAVMRLGVERSRCDEPKFTCRLMAASHKVAGLNDVYLLVLVEGRPP